MLNRIISNSTKEARLLTVTIPTISAPPIAERDKVCRKDACFNALQTVSTMNKRRVNVIVGSLKEGSPSFTALKNSVT